MESVFTAACVQVNAGEDMAANLSVASDLIRQARAAGAELIMTPENVAQMSFDKEKLRLNAVDEDDHPGVRVFSDLAVETGAWLMAGSLAIKATDKVANRCFLFAPDGTIAARYDKLHMFDVDLPGGESYRESATFQAGDKMVMADTDFGKLGLSICYDVRFPQLYRSMAKQGADFLSVPAAFTRTTGQAHWHVLLRARAIETGCFVFAPGQCGDHPGDRQTYGHSLIISPWGEVLADAGTEPGFVTAKIDTAQIKAARAMVPALQHDRDF